MNGKKYEYDLFISYNISDASIAQRIHDDLKKSNPQGFEVYCFQKLKYEPRDFWKEIQEALQASKYFCLLDSLEARNSTWVIRECELAWKLFKTGRIKAFIPVLIKPLELGDWRNSSFYKINQTVLSHQESNLSKSALDSLEQFMGRVFFSEDKLTAFLKKIECMQFIDVLKEHLLDGDLNRQFEEINRIKAIDLSGYTTFDHEGIYKDEMLQLCEVCGFKFDAFSGMVDARDFEDELEDLGLEKVNREILLRDYQAYLNRVNYGLGTARKRLEILREECHQLGFRLTKNSIEQLLAQGIPAKTISDLEKIKDSLYTTEVEFQNALLKQIGENAYDIYYNAIYRNVERGIKFFSLEISLAFLLTEIGELQQAYELIVEIIEEPRFAEDVRGWYALGRLEYYYKRNIHKAIHAYDKALEIIEKNPNNLFLQSNKILILYDKIKPLIDLDEIYQVKKILDGISPEFRSLPEYKYARTRSLISFDELQEAELILYDLYNRYKNENENWASYKLTESKIKRLKNSDVPEEVIAKIQNLTGTIFFTKAAFKENLAINVKYGISTKTDEILDRIINIAKYDREFYIQNNILASLDHLVYMALARKRRLTDALYYIERCNEVLSNDLVAKGDLALMYHVFGLPTAKVIDSSLVLKKDKMGQEYQMAIGKLYYLKGDVKSAKIHYSKLRQFEALIKDLKSYVPLDWKGTVWRKMSGLKNKMLTEGLMPLEAFELIKLLVIGRKIGINDVPDEEEIRKKWLKDIPYT